MASSRTLIVDDEVFYTVLDELFPHDEDDESPGQPRPGLHRCRVRVSSKH